MSKYKKITFLITLGLAFLLLMGCIYGYYNYRYYHKWQVGMMKSVLKTGGYTAKEDYQIDELGKKRDYYLHLSQIYGLLMTGVLISGTFVAFAVDLMKRGKES